MAFSNRVILSPGTMPQDTFDCHDLGVLVASGGQQVERLLIVQYTEASHKELPGPNVNTVKVEKPFLNHLLQV